jgi:hypothetical protein
MPLGGGRRVADHVVRDGDCLTSIAFANGFFWQTLWDHPRNTELRASRKDPFTLSACDIVHVPERAIAEWSLPTGQRHVFRRKGIPAWLKVQLLRADGTPRRDEAYELELDGRPLRGELRTDGDGWIIHAISPSAQIGRLSLDDGEEEHLLHLGHIRPIDELVGVQARLMNLGFYDGPLDDQMTDDTVAALQEFQASAGLDPVGELDDATRDALKAAFGG